MDIFPFSREDHIKGDCSMSDRSYKKGTVPCRTWRMLLAMEEDQYLKRPAVPGENGLSDQGDRA